MKQVVEVEGEGGGGGEERKEQEIKGEKERNIVKEHPCKWPISKLVV